MEGNIDIRNEADGLRLEQSYSDIPVFLDGVQVAVAHPYVGTKWAYILESIMDFEAEYIVPSGARFELRTQGLFLREIHVKP